MRVQRALLEAGGMLNHAGIPNAANDARRLLAACLEVEPSRVTLLQDKKLTKKERLSFFNKVLMRADRHPVSQLVGGRAFFDRWFTITSEVLDPRPETETLIVEALSEPFAELLDLGTGSGVIAITLLAESPLSTGIATDISGEALKVATKNSEVLGVDDRVGLVHSNWYSAVGGTYDLIVSNPPYIAAKEMDHLQPEVRDHEPRIALTDEADGLTAYRAITAGAPDHLMPGGRLIVEIGLTQGQAVSQMMRDVGLQQIRVIPDLDGRDRVVVGRKP